MRFLLLAVLPATLVAGPWARHTIDSSSRGADGVRLADVNGDGLQDIATGWEEGGRVRVYLNPGPEKSKKHWPAVTVGTVGSPEDAVFADLDGDGSWDVISSTEGKERTLFVHFAPPDPALYLDPLEWRSAPIVASEYLTMWMFVLPADVDHRNGLDFFAGSKGESGKIGWWQSPRKPRNLGDWTWHPFYDAGWIMSLIARDMDGDGDDDLVATDRKGPKSGIVWFENPNWREHRIGTVGEEELMFMAMADLDGDGVEEAIAATLSGPILWYRRDEDRWQRFEIDRPKEVTRGKAVAAGDLDLDGRIDLAFTAEGANGDREGVFWLSWRDAPTDRLWDVHRISGPKGVKFDRIELLDLDADGDLDLITCEERDNLGVVWYENPAR